MEEVDLNRKELFFEIDMTIRESRESRKNCSRLAINVIVNIIDHLLEKQKVKKCNILGFVEPEHHKKFLPIFDKIRGSTFKLSFAHQREHMFSEKSTQKGYKNSLLKLAWECITT